MKKRILAVIVAVTIIATLFAPMFTVHAAEHSKDVVFEVGEVIFNPDYGEIEVPLYIAENNKNVYTAEIYLFNEQNLECTAILAGKIKDEIDKGGRVGMVEYGFNYTMNPTNNLALIDSAEPSAGITTTGLVATFCYAVPADFKESDIANYTFCLGEKTMLVAFDLSRPTFELKGTDEPVVPEVCEHAETSEVVTKEATCTTAGSKDIKCTVCGEVIKTVAIDALGHGAEKEVIVKEAEIGVAGLKEFRCSVCDAVLRTEEIPALEDDTPEICQHTQTSEVVTKNATCTEAGSKNIVCTVCGEVLETKGIDALGHTFVPDPENDVAPTCTQTGKTAYKCACGETKFDVVNALGHGAEKEVIVKEAEIGVAGLKEFRCSVCDAVLRTEEIPALEDDTPVVPPVDPDAKTIVFEIGDVTYNAEFDEIEVPLYIVENNSNIYAAEIVLLSNDGLVCSAILEGTIKDEIDKGGRVGVVEFGFNYTMNAENNLALVDSAESTKGVSTTGLVATFCFKAPDDFSENMLAGYTFKLGDRTLLVAFDMSRPVAVLKDKGEPIVPPVCEHAETKGVVTKEATCTTAGSKDIKCTVCGDVLETVAIDALGHGAEKEVIVKEAEIGVAGLKEIKCSVCDAVLRTEEIPALEDDTPEVCEHAETSEVVTKNATCTEAGSKNIVCTVCGEVIKTVVIDALGHGAEKEVIVKEAEIGVAGLKEFRCSVCDAVLRTEEIPALEDDTPVVPPVDPDAKTIVFEIGDVTYNAEFDEIEVPLYIVENNSDIYAAEIILLSNDGLVCSTILEGKIKDEIDKGGRVGVVEFGFNYTMNPVENLALVDSAEPTKGVATTGLVATFCFTAPADFSEDKLAGYTFKLGERTLLVAFDMSRPVAVLKDKDEPIVPPACEHAETTEVVTKEATCTTAGSKNIVCTVCGEVLETKEIDALGHTKTEEVKKATCTENGFRKVTCSVCGEVLEYEEYEALGHKFERDEANDVAPTCTQTGKTAYKCSVCGETKFDVVNALGHGATKEEVTLEATCTTDGSKNVICTVCGEIIETVVIKATGHGETKAVVVKEATCTENGIMQIICKVCDGVVTDNVEITATGHGEEKEVVTLEPACTADGSKNIVCSVCGEVFETIKIDALGHTEAEEVKEATCTEIGYRKVVCSVCGEVLEYEEYEALGHKFERDEANDVAPTCTQTGKTAYKCSVCGETKFDVVNALGHGAEVEVVVKEATFGVAGLKEIKCSVCGEVLRTEEIPPLAYQNGDVNGDGSVDAKDLRLVKFILAELIALDDPEIKNLEVDDESGTPNAKDLRVIKLMLAELPVD